MTDISKVPSLSIVVTTYNRKSAIASMVEELKQQSCLDFELVVAIDGSTDGTDKLLDGITAPFLVKYIDTQYAGYGLAIARNQGILAAVGKAVVIIDDDSIPCPEFVEQHISSVQEGVISGGPRYPKQATEEYQSWKMTELNKLPQRQPFTIDEIRLDWPNVYLIENNICLLRDDWIKIGLFSERLKMYGYIGQEFFERAQYLKYRYQLNKNAYITHNSELEGDNGFLRSRKRRETVFSGILRPALSRKLQYEGQLNWAKLADKGGVADFKFPAYWPAAIYLMPWSVGLLAAGSFKRAFRSVVNALRIDKE